VARVHEDVLQDVGIDGGLRIINEQNTLVSNVFTSAGPALGTIFLPHSVLRHTLYVHAGTAPDAPLLDSLSFVVDHTRAAMRRYPFVSGNVNTGVISGAAQHDVLVYADLRYPDSTTATANDLLAANYFPAATSGLTVSNGTDTFCYSPASGCGEASTEPFDYIRPSPYAYLRVRLLSALANHPAGYVKPADTLVPADGVLHQYIVDENIDLRRINAAEKIIYNPSITRVEADSLVFPSGYTFRNVTGRYPADSAVNAPSFCAPANVPVPYVQLPSDLDTAVYVLRPGARLFVEPCVYLYDLVIRVDSGATLSYHPTATYGNFRIIDAGGTIDSVFFNGFCNNCRCVQEHTVSTTTYINSNTTYNAGCIVNGLIIVNPGKVLTIRDCTVEFTDSERVGKRSGIIVRPGGRLLIDNAELTALACDRRWDGIEVQGDPSLLSPSFDKDDQGGVRIIDGGTISDARVGIYVGGFCPDGFLCPDDAEVAGGYVEIDSAVFRDNLIGIKFAPYARKNLSHVQNARFVTSRRMGDVIARLQRIEHILLDGKVGLPISGCRFENGVAARYPTDIRGTGIVAIDASFEVSECAFTSLAKGIDAYTFGGFLRRFHLHGNTFNAIPLAVTARGGYLHAINDNRFNATRITSIGGTPPTFSEDTTYGVYLRGSQMFEVSANAFLIDTSGMGATGGGSTFPYGVAVRNSNLGGGLSFRNRIEKQGIGIQAERDNRNLLLRCDTLADQAGSDYRINPIDASATGALDTLPDFGFACLQGGTAGNIFEGSAYNLRQINGTLLDYYGSGNPVQSIPTAFDIDDVFDCELSTEDSINCPNSLACWLIDCPPGGWPASADTLISDIDTLDPIPLRTAGFRDALLHSFVTLDSLAYALDLLEADSSLLSWRMLLPHRLDAGQSSQASALLSAIDNWQGPQADMDENEDYHSLYGIVRALIDSPTTVHAATPAQRETIRSVAQSPFGVAGAAQSILARIEGQRFTDWPDAQPAVQPKFSHQQASSEFPFLLYPNPSHGEVWLFSEQTMDRAWLHDLQGNTHVYPLGGGNLAQLRFAKPDGAYLLRVLFTDGRSATRKLILIK
jgi:hypothetical protein